MKYYPIYLNLSQRTVLLVGAGEIAHQKIPALLESGARIRLVAPEAIEKVDALVRAHAIEWQRRRYETRDLEGVSLVIAATDDPELQKTIAAEARARGIWVNIVDVTPLCDFIAPAIVSQGDLQIAISTGGSSPALAKMIRKKLEPIIGPEYGVLVSLLQRYRPDILKLPKPRRDSLWEIVVSDPFIDQLKTQGLEQAEHRLKELLHAK